MSNETEPARVAAAAGNAAECHVIVAEEEMRLLEDALRSLPTSAVKDLLSLGVCERCIARLLGLQAHGSVFSSVTTSTLRSLLVGDEDASCSLMCKDSDICNICWGVLQFSYYFDKEKLVRKSSAIDFVAMVADLVKREGHEIDSFSLEVQVPQDILENESAVWLYLKGKYGPEVWLQERALSERISVKDSLKSLMTNQLETLMGVKSGVSSFRIRLTYTKASKMLQSSESNCNYKRRKTENGLSTADQGSFIAGTGGSDFPTSEENEGNGRTYNDLQDLESSKGNELSLAKVNEPCKLVILCYRTPIYFGGRYLKYSRKVSQTRWIIDDERMGEASVEAFVITPQEIIGGNILPICQGDNYKFHAAGREDIDVRMLGSGRPFLVEIQNPRRIPTELYVKDIEAKINSSENRPVGVKNLRLVGSQGWTLMREGESEKQKQYAALVWISRPLEDKDLKSITSLKEMQISQRTPIRVLHRRSPLDRGKIIHWMRVEKISGSDQYFLLHLCTQAGTYIKEFVHGDLGRTHPSIGSILGCRAEILQLDVTDVKMDCFLGE